MFTFLKVMLDFSQIYLLYTLINTKTKVYVENPYQLFLNIHWIIRNFLSWNKRSCFLGQDFLGFLFS